MDTAENILRDTYYHFGELKACLQELTNSREKSLALTKLEECEMWFDKAKDVREF